MLSVFLFLVWSMTMPLPTTLPYEIPRYWNLDPRGGNMVILADFSEAIFTHERMRTDATRILFNPIDAEGVNQTDHLATLDAGDMIEWHQGDDCFVRYRVIRQSYVHSEVRRVGDVTVYVDPMSYAFTGCSGFIIKDRPVSIRLGPLPDLGGEALRVPIRHGPFQIVPAGWTGPTEPEIERPVIEKEKRVFGPDDYAHDTEEARRFRYWRDPTIPTGFTLETAFSGPQGTGPGYVALYASTGAGTGRTDYITITAQPLSRDGALQEAAWRRPDGSVGVAETRVLAGRPAQVTYSPLGPGHRPDFPVTVSVYHPLSQAVYVIQGTAPFMQGANIDAALAIAESLMASPLVDGGFRFFYSVAGHGTDSKPPGTFSLVVGGKETSRAVATYAEVQTFELLLDSIWDRPGWMTIHPEDADGIDRSDLWDAVEDGDMLEWRLTDDCFIRYGIRSARARKVDYALTVEQHTYAFAGCPDEIPTDEPMTLIVGDLPVLGGSSLTTAIRHGLWQLAPAEWIGPVEESRRWPHHGLPYQGTYDITVARTFLRFREPILPEGWSFERATSGTENGFYGSWAYWVHAESSALLEISGNYVTGMSGSISAGEGYRSNYAYVIAGRPALVTLRGSLNDPATQRDVHVRIYDRWTASVYSIRADSLRLLGGNIDAFLEIVASLFEPKDLRPSVS
ncbi:MAG: hypothetical protein OXG19_02865 [Chloroflexi bacterium]|nr:hypothetical protein [Chloroflexota bacterium]